MGEENMLRIERVQRIDDRHIEFYWEKTLISGKEKDLVFHVCRDGRELKLYERKDDDEWDVGTIYEPLKRRTTVTLAAGLEPEDTSTLTAWVENIVSDRPEEEQTKKVQTKEAWTKTGTADIHQVRYEPYYRQRSISKMGICIKSGERVSREAHEMAAEIVDILLGKLPEAAVRMKELHAELAIYSLGEDAYDIPEHRAGCLYMNRPVEGYGGIIENPVTSISEANVLRIVEGPNQTRYQQELILAHEFAHAIHLIGLKSLEDQTLYRRSIEVYEAAKSESKWPNSYAISNFEEYFATLTTIWFNVMEEGKNGTWDGVRGPVNTREELKRYDRRAYEFFREIYTTQSFPHPWDTVRNEYDIDGSKYQKGRQG